MAEEFTGRPWHDLAAGILLRRLGLRRGQSVIIETRTDTLSMAETLAIEARRLGIRPVLFHEPDRLIEEARRSAKPADAHAIARAELAAAAATDGYIHLHAGLRDLHRWDALPPAHREAFHRRQRDWRETLVAHGVPSVNLLAASVNAAGAAHFEVDEAAWRRESLRASLVAPAALRKTARPLARALATGKRVTLLHPNGTHLVLGLAGRAPYVDDGAVDAGDVARGHLGTTVPGGYLTVAVDERVAEGKLVSNRPSRGRRGVISGLDWTFHNGALVRYEVGRGRELFDAAYRAAGRERARPALLEVGLNPEIRDFPFAEDQELGVVSVEIGHNDDFGGRTRGRFRQVAILRGADLLVDDRPILRGGRLARG